MHMSCRYNRYINVRVCEYDFKAFLHRIKIYLSINMSICKLWYLYRTSDNEPSHFLLHFTLFLFSLLVLITVIIENYYPYSWESIVYRENETATNLFMYIISYTYSFLIISFLFLVINLHIVLYRILDNILNDE